ncbi:MAG TPA: LacI family DNA-binding transcriptional regulator [Phenylobacterium sp.]
MSSDPLPKARRTGKATVHDVGRLAGVSGRTVSRVINGEPSISPGTLERVKAAMATLEFEPNMAARSLRSARSFSLCLLTAHISNFYYAEVIRGLSRACSARDRRLIIQECSIQQAMRAPAGLLKSLNTDGCVLLPPLCDAAPLLDALDDVGLSYVRIAPAADPGRSPAVFSDDEAGVRDLVRHLWDLGHRRFGHIAGPPGHYATLARSRSFTASLLEAGAEPADIAEVGMRSVDDSPEESRRLGRTLAYAGGLALDSLLARPRPPTAIFAFSDELAIGAVARAQHLGLSVPGDIAIAGFDDSDIGAMIHPALTTIRPPLAKMMDEAVDRLVAGSAGRPIFRHPVELRVGPSTDPRFHPEP